MKKLFTLAAAVLASFSLWAADFVPATTAVYKVGDASTLGPQFKDLKQKADYFEVEDTVVFSPFVLYQSAATGWQEWTGSEGAGSSGTSWNAIAGRCFKGSAAMFNSDAKAATVRSSRIYYYNVTNCTQVMALVKTSSSITLSVSAYEIVAGEVATDAFKTGTYKNGSNGIVSIEGLDAAKTYRIKLLTDNSGSNSSFYEIAFVMPHDATPALNVSSATATLAVTASKATDEAKVTFTGKNLTDGTYDLSLTSVAGLSVSPTSVTVADGALNQEVTISYESATDVAEAAATLSLTIDEITKSVAITYSAEHAKNYINASVNIEQWVLDNGKKDAALKAVLDAANIDYNSIDALDSLNDEKSNRNYAFLGLKMKKADASLGCWLQAGSTLKVRFGNVGANFLIRANGVEQTKTADDLANATVDSSKELSFTAEADTYLEIVCNSTKTLVVKQIMLNEAIAAITLPANPATALDNTKAEAKALKVVRDGQLFIEKNGVMYNAQGAVVR